MPDIDWVKFADVLKDAHDSVLAHDAKYRPGAEPGTVGLAWAGSCAVLLALHNAVLASVSKPRVRVRATGVRV